MKNTLKKFVAKSRILKPLRAKNHLMILNYHRIVDPRKKILFDDEVYGPDPVRFETEMKWLKNETRILSENELIEILYNKKPMNEVCSMVTFDDGYVDNYDLAYPVLNKLKIPATFFIPTKHIEERSLGWWDIAAYIVKNTKKKELTFRDKKFSTTDKQKVISALISDLKKTEATEVGGYLSELAQAFNVEIPSQEMQGMELMTWDQIKEVSKNGITIGSHTHEHTILSRQDIEKMRAQIKLSKDILESKIEKKIQSIAYPVGGYSHFNEDAKTVSKELDFKIGYSFLTGVNRFPSIDPFDVRRGMSQKYWDNLDFALAFPDKMFQKQAN